MAGAALVIGIGVVKRLEARDWTTAASVPNHPSFESVRALDPTFSRIVFDDFVHGLYAAVRRTWGLSGSALDGLSAYLSPSVIAQLRASAGGPVDEVIVGAMRPVVVDTGPQGSRITVEIEANYTQSSTGYYVVERWTFRRAPGARSRTPERARMLGCPSCGAPQDGLFGGKCRYCNKSVNGGAFDWSVERIDLLSREERGPVLTSDIAERGTDAPTIVDPTLAESLAALQAKDPEFDGESAKARLRLVFEQFQRAWSARDLTAMRPFLSDTLFSTQQYWVAAYVSQGLRNETAGARITRLELVKVASDAYYDALTFRLFATGLDYTIDENGRVVSGSRTTERAYTEYWTMIRGTDRRGPPRVDLTCPNCGASLTVNMAGECGHCRAHLTTGDFDWVLSRIEQDDAYVG